MQQREIPNSPFWPQLEHKTVNVSFFNTMPINVTKSPLTLRLKNLNLEHKNRQDIYFTNIFFVIQMCQAQEQKTLCFDSLWGSGWHNNDWIGDVNDIFPITQTKPYCWNIYMLFSSREVGPYWEKLCPRSWIPPEAAGLGRYSRQRAQFFLNTDRPRLVNNIFIFFYNTTKGVRKTRTF